MNVPFLLHFFTPLGEPCAHECWLSLLPSQLISKAVALTLEGILHSDDTGELVLLDLRQEILGLCLACPRPVPGSAPGMFLPPESIVRFSPGPPIHGGKPGQGPSRGSQPWTFWAFQVAP